MQYFVIFASCICALYLLLYIQVKKKKKPQEGKKMKTYKIEDKETKLIIGVLVMTPEQARKAEKDFIIKEI